MMKRVNKLGEKGFMRSMGTHAAAGRLPARLNEFEGERRNAGYSHGTRWRQEAPLLQHRHRRLARRWPLPREGRHHTDAAARHADRVKLNTERLSHWLGVGARPSDRVAKFLAAAELMKPRERREQSKAAAQGQGAERAKAAAEAAGKTEEAAARGRPLIRDVGIG